MSKTLMFALAQMFAQIALWGLLAKFVEFKEVTGLWIIVYLVAALSISGNLIHYSLMAVHEVESKNQ